MRCRPPVDFFQVEEGLAALSELNNPSSRTLPPNSMRIPTKRMVPLPPVTPPDFPAGASMQGLQSIYPADSFIGTVSPAGGPVVHINTDTENVFSEQSYDTSPAFPDESQNYYDTMSPETAAKMEARRAVRAHYALSGPGHMRKLCGSLCSTVVTRALLTARVDSHRRAIWMRLEGRDVRR
jgi:hypothetical protein